MLNKINSKIFKKTACLLAVVFIMVACQSKTEVLGPPVLNGNWASTDGVYVAKLLNGKFQAVANDTGAVISEGTYLALALDKVQIDWVGRVSGKSNSAECLKPQDNQLDCIDKNGNSFSLRRAA